MANEEQLERLKRGVEGWNRWREENPREAIDLSSADLTDADLEGANLEDADLVGADLTGARLTRANLMRASVSGCRLTRANLEEAQLAGAYLAGANMEGANLQRAEIWGADLTRATLVGANLNEADLERTSLDRADLREAKLEGANLTRSLLVKTNLENADLTGCHVYGASAWDVKLNGAKQVGLEITLKVTPRITVDDLEVAQFIYLLLNNEKVRKVIDTVTSKVVLVLGRFTPERKAVLDALRERLRAKNYSPVVFDFEKPASRDITETVRVLAGMARFVVADITDAKSIPQELMAIVPDLPSVPVQPLLLASQQEYGMFEHFRSYPWMLENVLYDSPDQLVRDLDALVIAPAERWLKERRQRDPEGEPPSRTQ